ncbi:MAG: hypothetical protein ICV75_01820 [Nitrospiraceae bacterium]|nr:hypothetical protein [Nitrospiraceae bacterium]
MNTSEQCDVIRQYLQEQFPKHFIADFLEGASRAQVFRVDAPSGRPLHYAVLGIDFLQAHTAEGLHQALVTAGLSDKLKAAGSAPVTLSLTGCRTEGVRTVV